MPSSTSSSEPRRVDPVAARTAIAAALLLLAAMGIIRGCTEAVRARVPDPFGIQRIRTAYAALPEIAAAPGAKAIVFGSSIVEFGFSPAVFDAEMADAGVEIISYNLGLGNMNPTLQLALARRMRRVFESRGARVDLMLVEFNPFQATRKRVAANEPFEEAVLSVLSTPGSLWAAALEDPERAVRMATIKYPRGGVAAEAITSGLGFAVGVVSIALGLGADEEPDPEYEAVLAERRELFSKALAAGAEDGGDWHPAGGWQLSTRGAWPAAAETPPEVLDIGRRLMANLAHPRTLEEDLERRVSCCDIVDLHFEERFVADFVALVRELAAISDRIEVVLMPKNYDWVKNPPEALARQRSVVERIERETGVRVRDYQYLPELPGGWYFDVTHLSWPDGRDRFTRILAADWADRLRVR